jgi:AraC-like DNA-binding protein
MSIRLVWPFLALARQHQRDDVIRDIQARLGLTPAEFDDPDTRIPLQLAVDLLDESIARTGQRNLGLLAAAQLHSEHVGIAEYVARAKATLGEALASSVHYVRLLGDGAHHSLETRDDLAMLRIWFDSNLLMHEAGYEFAVASALVLARRLSRMPDLAPLEVHFMHPAPFDLRDYSAFFRCPVIFNMPITQMLLSTEALAIPLASAEPALGRLLERQADAMLAGLPRTDDLVTRVRDMLTAETDLCETSATRVARRLGMSVRTLARRLGEESTSYRMLLDETRKHAALRDLSQTMRPINDIAHQLGFASSQSFHRAFRRWTGDTAASYRDRSRQRTTTQKVLSTA